MWQIKHNNQWFESAELKFTPAWYLLCFCRWSSKNNYRRPVECVNMLFMSKVNKSFLLESFCLTSVMFINYYIKQTLSKIWVKSSTVLTSIPLNVFLGQLEPLILNIFCLIFTQIDDDDPLFFPMHLFLPSTNLTSWREDPAVPGAVSELCHP